MLVEKQIKSFVNSLPLLHRNEIFVVVGSGISVASGLKTFRGKEGHYSNYRPEELASPIAFLNNPNLVWSWYKERISNVFKSKPNVIHQSLVKLEKSELLDLLITQNVDGLHRIAGQTKLIEIHGSITRTHCFNNCGVKKILTHTPSRVPIKCTCGSLQRPSVVWFGENINTDDINMIMEKLKNCKLVITIGTSGNVYPVANFPIFAQQHNAIFVDINIEPTYLSNCANYYFKGKAEEIIPKMVDELIKRNQIN